MPRPFRPSKGRRRQQHGAEDRLEQAAALGPGQHRRDADGIVAHRQAQLVFGQVAPAREAGEAHAALIAVGQRLLKTGQQRAQRPDRLGRTGHGQPVLAAEGAAQPAVQPHGTYSFDHACPGSATLRGSIRARSRRTPRVRNRVRTGDAAWRPATGAGRGLGQGSSPRNTPAWLARSERTCISTTSPGPSVSSARKGRNPASA